MLRCSKSTSIGDRRQPGLYCQYKCGDAHTLINEILLLLRLTKPFITKLNLPPSKGLRLFADRTTKKRTVYLTIRC